METQPMILNLFFMTQQVAKMMIYDSLLDNLILISSISESIPFQPSNYCSVELFAIIQLWSDPQVKVD